MSRIKRSIDAALCLGNTAAEGSEEGARNPIDVGDPVPRPMRVKKKARILPANVLGMLQIEESASARTDHASVPSADTDMEEERAVEKVVFKVGDSVLGHYQDGHWYAADIVELFGDKFVVAWDDGDTEDTVKTRDELRLRRGKKPATPKPNVNPPRPKPEKNTSDKKGIVGVCSECGKEFKSMEGLNQHIMSHTGEKPLDCPVCGKGFRQPSALRNHLLIHAGIKAYSCGECGKAFTEKSQLKVHLLTHSGEKPHRCPVCGKGYTTAANCKEHELTHTDLKPHVCQTCGKAFRHRSVLQKHYLTHSGERPWVCETCGKGFQKSCNLQRHQLTHSGEKPYPCPKCGRKFGDRSAMAMHVRANRCKTHEESADEDD